MEREPRAKLKQRFASDHLHVMTALHILAGQPSARDKMIEDVPPEKVGWRIWAASKLRVSAKPRRLFSTGPVRCVGSRQWLLLGTPENEFTFPVIPSRFPVSNKCGPKSDRFG